MSVVVIVHTTEDLKPALDAIFAPHGGIEAVAPPTNKVTGYADICQRYGSECIQEMFYNDYHPSTRSGRK